MDFARFSFNWRSWLSFNPCSSSRISSQARTFRASSRSLASVSATAQRIALLNVLSDVPHSLVMDSIIFRVWLSCIECSGANTANVKLGRLAIAEEFCGNSINCIPGWELKTFLISALTRSVILDDCTLARRSANILFKLGDRLKRYLFFSIDR